MFSLGQALVVTFGFHFLVAILLLLTSFLGLRLPLGAFLFHIPANWCLNLGGVWLDGSDLEV